MGSSVRKAIELILSADPELLNILSTTARVCLTSSILALIIGVPVGILFGAERFPGRKILLVLNRTLIGMPPVVCGLMFYMLFSGVGPFRHLKLLFTVKLMIIAQVVLITPIIIGVMETFVADTAPALRETARGLGFGRIKEYRLLVNECLYSIFSAYLLSFARAIAEVGAVAMVGGAIAWKTNVMTTAIMMYTNRGSFTLAWGMANFEFGMFTSKSSSCKLSLFALVRSFMSLMVSPDVLSEMLHLVITALKPSLLMFSSLAWNEEQMSRLAALKAPLLLLTALFRAMPLPVR